MSDFDEKGRKALDWRELEGLFSAMVATFSDGLQFHVYADNTLYLCRPAGLYDNVYLGVFPNPFAKAEEIAATLTAPVESPVLSRAAIDEMIAKIEREDGHEWNAVMAMESLRDAILESLKESE